MIKEALSNMERRWRDDEIRRNRGASVVGYVPPPPSPEQLAEAKRQQMARALPDELFEDDEQLQRLREVYDTRSAINSQRHIHLHTLGRIRQALTEQIQLAEQELTWQVLTDLHRGDEQLCTARGALATIAENKALLHVIADAVLLANQRPDQFGRIEDEVAAARQAWSNHLTALKLAHVDGLANETEVW